MAVFSCPECGGLSQSNKARTYYWCSCGRPLTAADAVAGMADSVADATPSEPVSAEDVTPAPEAEAADVEAV
jgi:hypothetical protein